METLDTIKQQIESNDIILYMKGSPQQPQCGFSANASQCLMECGEKFAYVDVISNSEIRSTLPKFSNWPTFPQLYIQGELIGGSDIIAELFNKGELQSMVKDGASSEEEQDATE